MGKFSKRWDDFTGGFFVGPNDLRQPDNTWRGVDVQVSPVDGSLTRRAEPRQVYSAPGAFTPPSTTEQFVRSQPVVYWSDTYGAGGIENAQALCVAWWEVFNTYEPRFIVANYGDNGDAPFEDVNDLGSELPTSNPIVAYTGANAKVYFATHGPNIIQYSAYAGTFSTNSTPEVLCLLARWGEFMVGAAAETSKLYFSTQDVSWGFITWNALDYYQIGEIGEPIAAIVVVRDQLWVGKASGWWVLTGVLDDFNSITIRQVNDDIGPKAVAPEGTIPNALLLNYHHRNGRRPNAAVVTDLGIVFAREPFPAGEVAVTDDGYLYPDGSGFGLSGLRGVRSDPVMYWPQESFEVPQPPLMTVTGDVHVSGGQWAITSGAAEPPSRHQEGLSWVLDGARWARVTVGAADVWTAGLTVHGAWCADFVRAGPNPRGQAYYLETVYGASDVSYRLLEWPVRTTQANLVKPATVELASVVSKEPFKVDHLYVEVILNPKQVNVDDTLVGGIAAVTATVKMDGCVELDGHAESSPISSSVAISSIEGSIGSGTDERRYTFKLSPGDAPVGLEATPVLEFLGCRIRRVTAVCTEVGWP